MIFPNRSHINGVLTLAYFFKKEGFNVYFLINGSLYIDAYIKKQGFGSILTSSIPFGLPWKVEWSYYKKQGLSVFQLYFDRLKSKSFEERRKVLSDVIARVKPSRIFIDSFIGGDFLCLFNEIDKHNIQLSFVNTMGICLFKGLPPPDSMLFPSQRVRVTLATVWRAFKRSLFDGLEYLIFFEKSSMSRIYSKMRDLGIPRNQCITENRPLGITFKNHIEYVLGSKAFDFPISTKQLEYKRYLGMTIHLHRIELVAPSYKVLSDQLSKKDNIVYVSFGSLAGEKLNTIRRLIKIILKVSAKLPQITFIVSSPEVPQKPIIGSNVYFFKSVHQLAQLSRSKIFVTHGGFNSIKESIHFGVPMIVYPINSNYDQIGNSARIRYHDIGLAERHLNKETTTGLLTKINTLLRDYDYYMMNISRLRESIRVEKINFNDIFLSQKYSQMNF